MGCKDNNFVINDQVIHCREGLSTILSSKMMGEREYFLVKSNNSGGETIYVPVERASDIIRHIMNEEEAIELLTFMKGIKKEFNTNTKQRRDAYKKRLGSGQKEDIAYLCMQLHYYKQLGPDNDEIKLGPVDLNILEYASNMLLDELALTFNIARDKVHEFMVSKLAK